MLKNAFQKITGMTIKSMIKIFFKTEKSKLDLATFKKFTFEGKKYVFQSITLHI